MWVILEDEIVMQYDELIKIVNSKLGRPKGAKHFTGPPALDDDRRVRWMLEDPESLSLVQLSVLIEDGHYPVSVYYAAYAMNLKKYYEVFGEELLYLQVLIWVGGCREEMIRDGINDAVLKRIETLFFEELEAIDVVGDKHRGYEGNMIWSVGVDASEVFRFFKLIDKDPAYGTPYAYVDGVKLAECILDRWLNELDLNAKCSAFLLNVIYEAAFCLDKNDLYRVDEIGSCDFFKALASDDKLMTRHWAKGGELWRGCCDDERFENMKNAFL